MDASELGRRIRSGEYRCVPQAFAAPPSARALTARLEVADELAAELAIGDSSGSPTALAQRVIAAAGDPVTILKIIQSESTVPRRVERRVSDTSSRDIRRLYGFSGSRWSKSGQHPSARVAACLAADFTWLPYAHGLVIARDHAPAPLSTDLQTLSATLYLWAVQDHPAVALALGSALVRPEQDRAIAFHAFGKVFIELVRPHLGGTFAEPAELVKLEQVASHISRQLLDIVNQGRTPLFTSSRLTGLMVEALTSSFPELGSAGVSDRVTDFERAAADLVFDALVRRTEPAAAFTAIEHLQSGLEAHQIR